MNRAQRRRNKREKQKNPTYNLSKKQLKEAVNKEIEGVKKVAIDHTVKALTASFIIALHDEYGFGPKRLERVLDKVQLQFECVTEGTVTIEELQEWCLEYGIELQ